MKALKYYGPHNVDFIDIPKPKAGPGQVVVRIAYCGICGSDVHAFSMGEIFNWELVLGEEFISMFLLERPDQDMLRHYEPSIF